MSLLASFGALVKRSAANLTWSLEDPRIPLSGRNVTLASGLAYGTQSGKTVSPRQALQYAPFQSGVSLIAQDISKLQLKTYERQERGKEEAFNHPVYNILNGNVGETTSNLFIETLVYNTILYGNAYAWIQRRGDGRPLSLWHVYPWRVTVWRNTRTRMIFYKVFPVAHHMEAYQRGGAFLDNKVPAIIGHGNMLHVRGLTPNGLIGMPIIQMGANILGRYLSTEQYSDDFFRNACIPQGLFQHPKSMSEQAIEKFQKRVNDVHAGSGQRHRMMVLEEDMKWTSTRIKPEEAMLKDLLAFGVKDVARLLKIPAPLLQDPDCAGGYNSEIELTRRYYNMALAPYMDRIERECNDKLFTDDEKERRQYEVQFDPDPLLRADSTTRMQQHRTLVELGARTPNEVREIEGYNAYEEGDVFLAPLNLAPQVGDEPQDGQPTQEEPQEPAVEDDEAARQAEYQLLETMVLQSCERFIRPIEASRGNEEKIVGILDTLDEKHRAVIVARLLPVADVLARGDGSKITDELVTDILVTCGTFYREILDHSSFEELEIRLPEASEMLRHKLRKMLVSVYFPRLKDESHEYREKKLPAGAP